VRERRKISDCGENAPAERKKIQSNISRHLSRSAENRFLSTETFSTTIQLRIYCVCARVYFVGNSHRPHPSPHFVYTRTKLRSCPYSFHVVHVRTRPNRPGCSSARTIPTLDPTRVRDSRVVRVLDIFHFIFLDIEPPVANHGFHLTSSSNAQTTYSAISFSRRKQSASGVGTSYRHPSTGFLNSSFAFYPWKPIKSVCSIQTYLLAYFVTSYRWNACAYVHYERWRTCLCNLTYHVNQNQLHARVADPSRMYFWFLRPWNAAKTGSRIPLEHENHIGKINRKKFHRFPLSETTTDLGEINIRP